ncbi:MAG: 2-succinyl-6-hydroxy-2,4-cyclohexadiene-1-carboxylate synthase [Myxococcota bacterium]
MLATESWGSGPIPVLLLHGFTHAKAAWRVHEEAWAPLVRAIAVDLPGHGSSPADTATSFEDTAQRLAAIAHDTFGGPFVVIGYSLGARVALAMAVLRPRLVSALVLESGSPGLADDAERAARRVGDDELATRIEHLGVPAFLREWEQQPVLAGLRTLPAEQQDLLRALRLTHSASQLARALRLLSVGAQPSYWHRLDEIACPTLLVHGEHDERYTRIAREMEAALPHARRVMLPCGHTPHLECAEAYASDVAGFLRTCFPTAEASSVSRSPT